MSSSEKNKILVIDDDEGVLIIVRKLLEAEMFSVDVSLSAREALARLPHSRYSVILCDMWMPGMTGKEFYQRLRSEFPEYLSRIIFLTGDIASEATWDFIEETQRPYVLKPVSIAELRRKVQEVTGGGTGAGRRAAKTGADNRRHRRVGMKASVRVRKKKWETGGPEITAIHNASREGVYFLTNRQYRVGMDLLISFPYTGANDVEQEGVVVRVDERSEGRRGVAVAWGDAAAAARASMVLPEEDRKRARILALADMSVTSAPSGARAGETGELADLRLQLAREREEKRRLDEELSDLKRLYERVAEERDRLAADETQHSQFLRELNSANAALNRTVEDLKRDLQTVRNQLAATEKEREQARRELDRRQPGEGGLGKVEAAEQERDRALAELAAARDQLSARAAQSLQAKLAVEPAARAMAELRQELAAAKAERDEAKRTLEAALEGQEPARAPSKQGTGGVSPAEAERDLARAELEAMRRELEQLRTAPAARPAAAAPRQQSRQVAELQEEREQLQRQLRNAHEELEQLRASERVHLQQLRATQKELEQRRSARTLQEDLVAADTELVELQKQVESLKAELEKSRAGQPGAAAPAAQPAASPAAAGSEIESLREQLAEKQARLDELHSTTVGPLTVLAAYLDMLAMDKSLNSKVRKTVKETLQQASLLRAAFQRLLKKTSSPG